MKTGMVFIASAIFLSNVFGNDPGLEERYKMKTGRYTPAEEARRNKARIAAKAGGTVDCAKKCSAGLKNRTTVANSNVSPGDPGAAERFRMKYGRMSPAAESRAAAAKQASEPVLTASSGMCQMDCCKHGQ